MPYAHGGLASDLDLSSYETIVCSSYFDEDVIFPIATLVIM